MKDKPFCEGPHVPSSLSLPRYVTIFVDMRAAVVRYGWYNHCGCGGPGRAFPALEEHVLRYLCHLDFYWLDPDSQRRCVPFCSRDMSGHWNQLEIVRLLLLLDSGKHLGVRKLRLQI